MIGVAFLLQLQLPPLPSQQPPGGRPHTQMGPLRLPRGISNSKLWSSASQNLQYRPLTSIGTRQSDSVAWKNICLLTKIVNL